MGANHFGIARVCSSHLCCRASRVFAAPASLNLQANTTVLPSSNLSICNPLILLTVWLKDKLSQTSFVFPNNQSISCRRQGYRYLATGYDFPGISQPKPKQELVKWQVQSCPLKLIYAPRFTPAWVNDQLISNIPLQHEHLEPPSHTNTETMPWRRCLSI